MKDRSIIPTQRERVMRENDFIVSKTDPRGIITYGNPIFIEFSGYGEEELLGTQHNIIRHPDMPRSAFKLVWDTIQSGKEVFAYVKNMSKDGGFYWVFTHITPDFGPDGAIVGYTSVRRCPKRSAIEKIEPVYRQMLAAEQAAGTRDAIAAGTAVLVGLLKQTGMSYEELVFSL
jgi:PAS domain S-box-containing protein